MFLIALIMTTVASWNIITKSNALVIYGISFAGMLLMIPWGDPQGNIMISLIGFGLVFLGLKRVNDNNFLSGYATVLFSIPVMFTGTLVSMPLFFIVLMTVLTTLFYRMSTTKNFMTTPVIA